MKKLVSLLLTVVRKRFRTTASHPTTAAKRPTIFTIIGLFVAMLTPNGV